MVPLKVQQGSSLGNTPVDNPIQILVHIPGEELRDETGNVCALLAHLYHSSATCGDGASLWDEYNV